jgi:hypothetical protein
LNAFCFGLFIRENKVMLWKKKQNAARSKKTARRTYAVWGSFRKLTREIIEPT